MSYYTSGTVSHIDTALWIKEITSSIQLDINYFDANQMSWSEVNSSLEEAKTTLWIMPLTNVPIEKGTNIIAGIKKVSSHLYIKIPEALYDPMQDLKIAYGATIIVEQDIEARQIKNLRPDLCILSSKHVGQNAENNCILLHSPGAVVFGKDADGSMLLPLNAQDVLLPVGASYMAAVISKENVDLYKMIRSKVDDSMVITSNIERNLLKLFSQQADNLVTYCDIDKVGRYRLFARRLENYNNFVRIYQTSFLGMAERAFQQLINE